MPQSKAKIASVDPVWDRIRAEAERAIHDEPLIGSMVHAGILHHDTLDKALSYRLALKLSSAEMSESILRDLADEAHWSDPELGHAARADLVAVFERDPACHRLMSPLLFFKGFQAIQSYRLAHWLWVSGRTDMAVV